MASYEKMYHKLFNAITDSINILQQAQLQTEEMYISQEDASSNSFQSDAYSENRNSGEK